MQNVAWLRVFLLASFCLCPVKPLKAATDLSRVPERETITNILLCTREIVEENINSLDGLIFAFEVLIEAAESYLEPKQLKMIEIYCDSNADELNFAPDSDVIDPNLTLAAYQHVSQYNGVSEYAMNAAFAMVEDFAYPTRRTRECGLDGELGLLGAVTGGIYGSRDLGSNGREWIGLGLSGGTGMTGVSLTLDVTWGKMRDLPYDSVGRPFEVDKRYQQNYAGLFGRLYTENVSKYGTNRQAIERIDGSSRETEIGIEGVTLGVTSAEYSSRQGQLKVIPLGTNEDYLYDRFVSHIARAKAHLHANNMVSRYHIGIRFEGFATRSESGELQTLDLRNVTPGLAVYDSESDSFIPAGTFAKGELGDRMGLILPSLFFDDQGINRFGFFAVNGEDEEEPFIAPQAMEVDTNKIVEETSSWDYDPHFPGMSHSGDESTYGYSFEETFVTTDGQHIIARFHVVAFTPQGKTFKDDESESLFTRERVYPSYRH